MSTSTVSNLGASVAINSGGTDVVILTDVNGDGRIGRGDGYLVASQDKGFGRGGAAVVSGVFGTAVLAGGLVLWGVDGKMTTYLALVIVCGTAQWLMCKGWRS
jgi:hypothetical protein